MVSLAAMALLLAGCGKKETGSSASTSSSGAGGVVVLTLTANDTMKYSTTHLEAPAGATVRVTLTNTGTTPKAAMGHNFVLLKQGVNVEEFDAAATAAGPQADYIPAAKASDIIAHTKLLGPKEKGEVTFTAPTTPGEYTYICTFPAHVQQGMRGVLVVK
jgi:azurin